MKRKQTTEQNIKSETLGYSISRKSSADRGNASAQATNKMQQQKKADKAGFT